MSFSFRCPLADFGLNVHKARFQDHILCYSMRTLLKRGEKKETQDLCSSVAENETAVKTSASNVKITTTTK